MKKPENRKIGRLIAITGATVAVLAFLVSTGYFFYLLGTLPKVDR
jgi:penicillin-binding protein 1A